MKVVVEEVSVHQISHCEAWSELLNLFLKQITFLSIHSKFLRL